MVYPAKSEKVRWVDRKGSVVLLNPQTKRYHRLNGIAAWIWQRCDGTETIDQIISVLARKYNVSKYKAQRDVSSFINCLKKRGLVGLYKNPYSHI